MSDLTEERICRNWAAGSHPLVSVICHTFNHVNYVQQALESILIQETTFPFEIVIHDDASADGTGDVVQEYAEKYPSIIKTVVQQDNQYSKGIKLASLSFKHASGKYIALCDGDDYWGDVQKLRKQVTFLEENPEYVITYHDCSPFNEHGAVKKNFGGVRRDLMGIELQKSPPIFTLTTCFRNVFGEFPPEYHIVKFGDLFIWSLLGDHRKGKYMDDIQPASYRVHEGGVFSEKSKTEKIEMQLLTRCGLYLYHRRMGNKPLAQHFRKKMLVSLLRAEGVIGSFIALKDALVRKVR